MGAKYEGEWFDGLKEGSGVEQYRETEDVYVGRFKKGQPNGDGKYIWSTGAVYEGEFLNGLKHGKGKWRKGMGEGADVYIGDYREDKRSGEGMFTWGMTRASYKGQFVNDLMHGLGVYTWADGSTYEGCFEKGR